jgi:hypothetical protein
MKSKEAQWRIKKDCFKYLNNLPDDYSRAKQSLSINYRNIKDEYEKERDIIRKKSLREILVIIEKYL